MKVYIDDFKKHRVQLQEILSFYTALDVKVLVTNVTKMSDLVSRLFETKPEWEKMLATETQNLGIGERNKWIESDASLQAFIEATEGPVLKGIATKKVESKSKDAQSKNLSDLRDEMESPVDELCQRNKDIFELKLAFHTQQLQDTIEGSAQFVVRTLSGPYDRLLHEVCPFTAGFVYRSRTVFYQDLRELWKEMVSLGWAEGLID